MAETVFKIKRFIPEKNNESYFQTYFLEAPDGATILDCLNLIKWTQDGTLTFRMSCRSAICGSCAIKVNGHPMLACKNQASRHLKEDGSILIEPLGNMSVIKDLVVDLEPFWEKVAKVRPWLIPDSETPEKERYQSPEDQKKIDDASTCIMCASCYSDCNSLSVDNNFLGPTALAKAQRFVDDSRDCDTKKRIKELSEYTGVWDCTHCGECHERCPTMTKPLDRIKSLKTRALEMGVVNNNGARHALGFCKSVGHSGILNENTLPLQSVGLNIKEMIKLMPVGIRMFIKGKNPPLIHRPIKDAHEVRKLFKIYKGKK